MSNDRHPHDERPEPQGAGPRRSATLRSLLPLLAALAPAPALAQRAPESLDIAEYRVEGVAALSPAVVERTVYPYLGPARGAGDVEAARAALEKAYHDAGLRTVSVVIPPQRIDSGVVTLRVIESRVRRLRVTGAAYHDQEVIKAATPALAEGKTPDFDALQRELVALQNADRRVTPSVTPCEDAGLIDAELKVEDRLPLHGSLELNNRNNPDTKPLRLNGELRYDNLWQAGHGVGASFQVAPERAEDAKVFSAYYLARFAEGPDLMLSGTRQDSDVNTLGSFNVSGRGDVIGLRAIFELGAGESLYHSFSAGIERKSFDTALSGAGTPAFSSPITYYPISANYDATRLWRDGSSSRASLGTVLHLRGMGADEAEFETKRAGSGGGFMYLRGDVSHLQKLPDDFEFFVQAQGQASPGPLVSNEQFGVGGLSTVRGYYESETVGDNALTLSAELRTPALRWGGAPDEWRIHTFVDWAGATLNEALPGQQARYEYAAAGVGSRLKFNHALSGSVDVAVPLLDGVRTSRGDTRVTFVLRAEF